MSNMSPFDYLVHELTGRYKFKRDHAEDAAERLMWDQNVYNGFVQYLNQGIISEYNVQGHTVTSLIEQYMLDPLGAFLMLAELSKYPERGKRYLKLILEQGHEEPVIGEDGDVEIEFSFVGTPVGETVEEATPRCAKCGGELSWIEEYQRWYCYSCKEYAE